MSVKGLRKLLFRSNVNPCYRGASPFRRSQHPSRYPTRPTSESIRAHIHALPLHIPISIQSSHLDSAPRTAPSILYRSGHKSFKCFARYMTVAPFPGELPHPATASFLMKISKLLDHLCESKTSRWRFFRACSAAYCNGVFPEKSLSSERSFVLSKRNARAVSVREPSSAV
jgi:hypothetical protein